MEYIRILDATLYGGGQSPSASLTVPERLEIARLLERMGVDVIQAGFPISSPRDFEAVRQLANEIKQCTICAMARAREEDIEVAAAALRGAARPRIQIGLGVSDSYVVGKLGLTREAVLEMAVKAVQYARHYTDDVQYYAADAYRADAAYLYRVLEAVIGAGATTVNIPDAVGFSIPSEWGALIRGIREHVPNIGQAVISVHCHNDLGMATANTIEAVVNGARQVECSVNGMGERTGNACLEEIVMTLQARQSALGLTHRLNTKLIYPASQLVSHLTGFPVHPHKAVVGAKAFAYTSGMYQDGVLRGRTEAEVLNPADVGVLEGESAAPLLTGREGLRRRLSEMGFDLTDDEFERIYARFRTIASKKTNLEIEDLEAIVSGEPAMFTQETYHLEDVQVTCGINAVPVAVVRLQGPEVEALWGTSRGNGPVDAVFKAIDSVVGMPNTLLEYAVQAMTQGVDAVGKVTVRIQGEVSALDGNQSEKRVCLGRGADTDVIVASAKAYLFALNRLLAAQLAGRRRHAVTEDVRRELEAMRVRYGTAHRGDFEGWSAMRDEELVR
jgi:2-isopropylmalate synthase